MPQLKQTLIRIETPTKRAINDMQNHLRPARRTISSTSKKTSTTNNNTALQIAALIRNGPNVTFNLQEGQQEASSVMKWHIKLPGTKYSRRPQRTEHQHLPSRCGFTCKPSNEYKKGMLRGPSRLISHVKYCSNTEGHIRKQNNQCGMA